MGIETEAHQEEEPPAPARLPADLIGPVVGGLRSNDHIADATTVPLLDPSECDAFLEDLDETAWQRMKVWQSPVQDSGAPAPSRGVTDEKVRRGLQQQVPGGNSGPLASLITEQVFRVNRDVYGFRLVGVEHPVQLLRYGAESSDGYVEHIDLGPTTSLRKLSFSLLLSDPTSFDGGDLSFGSPLALARAQGTLTVFPSYLSHAVTPVTSGTRYTVVGFAIGPAFR